MNRLFNLSDEEVLLAVDLMVTRTTELLTEAKAKGYLD